jgi:hypothetical protein
MRLFLASANLGAQPARLLEIVDRGARAAVIMNAWDGDPGSRAEETSHMCAQLGALGLEADELDLRLHIADESDARLRRRLAGVGLVFGHGGNPFLLLRVMRASRCDRVIR